LYSDQPQPTSQYQFQSAAVWEQKITLPSMTTVPVSFRFEEAYPLIQIAQIGWVMPPMGGSYDLTKKVYTSFKLPLPSLYNFAYPIYGQFQLKSHRQFRFELPLRLSGQSFDLSIDNQEAEAITCNLWCEFLFYRSL
jgi:hypothetical protein